MELLSACMVTVHQYRWSSVLNCCFCVIQFTYSKLDILFFQKCAKALALLPKAHGDATTWSSLIRRILIAINYDLDFAFRGMEDGELFICIRLRSVCQLSQRFPATSNSEGFVLAGMLSNSKFCFAAATAERSTAALLPRGQDPPLLLGGHSVPANTFIQPGKSLWQQLVPRVALLLQSCNHLLTSPFPVPVSSTSDCYLSCVLMGWSQKLGFSSVECNTYWCGCSMSSPMKCGFTLTN